MAYTDFKSLKQVHEELGIKIKKTEFLQTKHFEINKFFLEQINRNFKDVGMFLSEVAICEGIISPILREVAYPNKLTIFSHTPLKVKGNDKLNGTPDYMAGVIGDDAMSIKNPVLCLGEAKKDDFVAGWGQVAAEMYAAQKKNRDDGFEIPIFGLVSNGEIWKFGKLENNLLEIDSRSYSFSELQKLFDTLNWIFSTCRKNLESILDLED